jgi:hypothetical protein
MVACLNRAVQRVAVRPRSVAPITFMSYLSPYLPRYLSTHLQLPDAIPHIFKTPINPRKSLEKDNGSLHKPCGPSADR